MSAEEDDVSLLEYMYVIGFTENQYFPSTRGSPIPGEPRYASQAKGYAYADRCNKGAEKILSGASEKLERSRRKSVTKIHTDMLDLRYELTERRKTTSPGPKFRSDFQQMDSRLSMFSPGARFRPEFLQMDSRLSMFSPVMSEDSRSSSSNSLPIIEVQQLPPLSQARFNNIPSVNPEAFRDQYRSTLRRPKYPRLTFPNVSKENAKHGKKSDKFSKAKKAGNTDLKHHFANNNQTGKSKADVTKTDANTRQDVKAKSKPALKRRNAGLRLVEHLDTIYGKYARRLPLREKTKLHLTYCQCSYDERAEKDRIDNVMRRYSSKTNSGPLDFTKLQRQIDRSKTMVW